MSNRIRSTVALVAVLGAMGIAPAAHADQQGPPCPPEGCVTSPPPITPGTGGVCTLADLDYVSDLLYEARRELTIEQRAHKSSAPTSSSTAARTGSNARCESRPASSSDYAPN